MKILADNNFDSVRKRLNTQVINNIIDLLKRQDIEVNDVVNKRVQTLRRAFNTNKEEKEKRATTLINQLNTPEAVNKKQLKEEIVKIVNTADKVQLCKEFQEQNEDWQKLKNGKLLDVAKREGFQVMLTRDTDMAEELKETVVKKMPIVMLASFKQEKGYDKIMPTADNRLLDLEKNGFPSGITLVTDKEWFEKRRKKRGF